LGLKVKDAKNGSVVVRPAQKAKTVQTEESEEEEEEEEEFQTKTKKGGRRRATSLSSPEHQAHWQGYRCEM
jgi:hypothetical protein